MERFCIAALTFFKVVIYHSVDSNLYFCRGNSSAQLKFYFMVIGDLFVLRYEISEEDHGIIEIFSSIELAEAAREIIVLSGKYPKLFIDHYRINDFVGMINNHLDCFSWFGSGSK